MTENARAARPRLSHAVIVKAPGLLPMWYSPAKLATELGVLPQTIRSWRRLGLPYRRDQHERLWIDGVAFAARVAANRGPDSCERMGEDEAYCFRCRAPVPHERPLKRTNGKQAVLTVVCPNCGTQVNREYEKINQDNYQLVSAYLEYQRRVLQLGDDSAERYRFYLRHVLLWAGESPLAQAYALRPTLPEYLIAARGRDGRAPRAAATHRKIVQNAKRLLSWAKLTYPREYRHLPMAWIDALRPPRGVDDGVQEHVYVSLDEVQQLIARPVSKDDLALQRDQAAVALLFVSGMRVGALCTLPIGVLDLPNRTVKQWPSLGVATKNRKSATTYLLDIPQLLAAVEHWDSLVRAQLPPESMWYTALVMRWGGATLSAEPPGRGRTVLAGKRLRALFTATGLPPKSPHKFRHGHAVWALQHAQTMADYKAISMNLMHGDVRVTDGIYAPLLGSDVRERIGRLSNSGPGAMHIGSELVPDGHRLSNTQLAAALRKLADDLAGK